MVNSLIETYLNNEAYVGSSKEGFQPLGYYYIGVENTVKSGLNLFLQEMSDTGYVLTREPILIDYLFYGKISYLILFTALPKLKYLEWMYEKNKKIQTL